MRHIIIFTCLFFLLFPNGHSQNVNSFVDPEAVFSRFDYYFVDEGIQIQYDLNLLDSGEFQVEDFRVEGVNLVYFPSSANESQENLMITPNVVPMDGVINIKISQNPINRGINLSDKYAGWGKIEAGLIYRLYPGDKKRKGPTIPILKQMSTLTNIMPAPSIVDEKMNYRELKDGDVNQKMIVVPIEFTPTYNEGIEIKDVRIYHVGSRNQINTEMSAITRGQRKIFVPLQSDEPFSPGAYYLDIDYFTNGNDTTARIRNIRLNKPTPPLGVKRIKIDDKEIKIENLTTIRLLDPVDHILEFESSRTFDRAIFSGGGFNPIQANLNTDRTKGKIKIEHSNLGEGINNCRLILYDDEHEIAQELIIYKNTSRTASSLTYLPELVIDDSNNSRQIKLILGLRNPSEEDISKLGLFIKRPGTRTEVDSIPVLNAKNEIVWNLTGRDFTNGSGKVTFIFEYNKNEIFRFSTIIIDPEFQRQAKDVVASKMEEYSESGDLENITTNDLFQDIKSSLSSQVIDNTTLDEAIYELADQAINIVKATREVKANQREKIEWYEVAVPIVSIALKAFGVPI